MFSQEHNCYLLLTKLGFRCLYEYVLLLLIEVVKWLRLALSKGANRVGVIFILPEDGNRSSLRNVLFLKKKTLDDGQSPKTWSFHITPLHISLISNSKYITLKLTSTWLQGATSQKIVNFILAAVRTWNLTFKYLLKHPSLKALMRDLEHISVMNVCKWGWHLKRPLHRNHFLMFCASPYSL
jgi:hypothetical protein